MRKAFIYYFMAILLLAGCASVPDRDLARTRESPVIKTEEALSQEYFEEGQWPDKNWWEMFGDPQLSALIERALNENPSLLQARTRIDYAIQFAQTLRARLFPELHANFFEEWEHLSKNGVYRSFFPLMNPEEIPATLDQIDLTLNFTYEFDFWGKNRNLFQAALGEARAAYAEEQQANLVMATLVAQTYISLQAKLNQLSILQKRVAQREQLVQLNQSRYTRGVENNYPVLASRTTIHQERQALLKLEQDIAIDKHLLNHLVGLGPDAPSLDTELSVSFNRPFSLPSHLSCDLLARRPDLIAQIWHVESSAHAIGAAKADFYPSINLIAFAGLESIEFSKLFKISSRTGGLVPAIHLPIFTAGRLRANLQAKVATFNQAVYGYNELVLNAAKEVADQLVTMQKTVARLNDQLIAVEDVSAQYKLLSARQAKGIDTMLSVIDQQEQLLDAQFQLINFQRDHLLSVVNLIKALGGGYSECEDQL